MRRSRAGAAVVASNTAPSAAAAGYTPARAIGSRGQGTPIRIRYVSMRQSSSSGVAAPRRWSAARESAAASAGVAAVLLTRAVPPVASSQSRVIEAMMLGKVALNAARASCICEAKRRY